MCFRLDIHWKGSMKEVFQLWMKMKWNCEWGKIVTYYVLEFLELSPTNSMPRWIPTWVPPSFDLKLESRFRWSHHAKIDLFSNVALKNKKSLVPTLFLSLWSPVIQHFSTFLIPVLNLYTNTSLKRIYI